MAELSPMDEAGQFRLGFAGDTYNTVWYLKRLRPDAHIAYLTALGRDDLSERMATGMSDAGIDTSHIARLADRTAGLYMISLKAGERSFTYWRDMAAARCLADDPRLLSQAMGQADTVYFSGITLAILDEAGRAKLFDALRQARAAGKTIAFDPNLRPRLWSGPAEMTETVMQGARLSDIALPSYEDEATHFSDADPEGTAARYADAGAATVIVKNGADPVLYRHDGESGVVEIPALARVVDTTAAGDSFNAGFMAARSRGYAVAGSILAGARVAGRVIAGRGALIPIGPDSIAP